MPVKCARARVFSLLAWLCVPLILQAQQPVDMKEVLDRLDRLEAQNQALMTEIRALRQQLAAAPPSPEAPGPPLEDKVEVDEQRIAELDQSKVSSEHRSPVTLTGMLLFNAFANGKGSAGVDNPVVAAPISGQADAGAIFRQSVIGLKVNGPTTFGGGKVSGSVYMDFFGGGTGLTQIVRLRVATIDIAWKNTTLGFAIDKPILSPREPDSLAQVGVSPLTDAGNLWLWQPQVRLEQRVAFGDNAGLRAQAGIYQTAESGAGLAALFPNFARARPGYQTRWEFWAQSGKRRIEIAPGFHASDTQAFGQSIPSRIFTTDWLIRPLSRVDLTGEFFDGENTGVLGGLRQGVSFLNGQPRPVHAIGGWAQVTLHMTQRAWFNFYSGQEDDRNSDLAAGAIGKNLSYGGNFIYRLGPNVLSSFEASQTRTTYLGSGTRMNPHYDLALAYLF